jgi:hypothetical protein
LIITDDPFRGEDEVDEEEGKEGADGRIVGKMDDNNPPPFVLCLELAEDKGLLPK